jgi:hypothetical protein
MTIPAKWISRFGKLIEVTSLQQLTIERDAYQAELDSSAEVDFAYYEVVDDETQQYSMQPPTEQTVGEIEGA